MSFSDAEAAILTWEEVGKVADDGVEADTWDAFQRQRLLAEDLKRLYEKTCALQSSTVSWVEMKVRNVEGLDTQTSQDQEELQSLYLQLSEAYQTVKHNSEDILAAERTHITEAIKDIEVMGAKLEYEINALISKVEDVEDGVEQFQAQVDAVEARAAELEVQLSTEGWLHWAVRSITGIGTGPYMNA